MVQFQIKEPEQITKNSSCKIQFVFIHSYFGLNRSGGHFIMVYSSGPNLSEGLPNNPITFINLSVTYSAFLAGR